MGEISNAGLSQDGFDLTQFYTVFFEEARENLANMESMLLDIDVSRPTDELIGRIRTMAAGEGAGPDAPDDARRLDIRIGPLKSGAAADGLVELFRDIPSLGTIEALDQGQLSADGLRRFKVTTRSPDS